MEKIPEKPEKPHQISRKLPALNKGKTTTDQNKVFGKILSAQLNPSLGPTDSPTIFKGLPELEGAYKAVTINLPDRKNTLVEKINASIDLLDTYASMLSDPEETLKQVNKFLEEVAEQTDQLLQELDQSPKTDRNLKQIITQMAAMVQVEQIKINRGDYTDIPYT